MTVEAPEALLGPPSGGFEFAAALRATGERRPLELVVWDRKVDQ